MKLVGPSGDAVDPVLPELLIDDGFKSQVRHIEGEKNEKTGYDKIVSPHLFVCN